MKKYFNYYLLILILSLVFLVYVQWFSAFAPVEYIPATQSRAPQHLESLPTIDIEGNKGELSMADAEVTLLITSFLFKDYDDSFIPYIVLSDLTRSLRADGIRVVYLWLSEKEDASLIEEYVLDDDDAKYLLNKRMLSEYQKYGIRVRNFFAGAYNKNGELIYMYQSDAYRPFNLATEIKQGVSMAIFKGSASTKQK